MKEKATYKEKARTFSQKIWKYRQIYMLLLPGVIWYILFAYLPMGGLVLAFKTYRAKLGIWGSPWNGFGNFELVFRDSNFWASIKQTLLINFGRLFICFPAPIILAVILNEIRMTRFSKVTQTILTFPNFLSWVVVASIFNNFLALDGPLNQLIMYSGGDAVSILGNKKLFIPLIFISDIWKSVGYSAIIFLAAISGIDQEQYEAAEVDGAGRWHKIWHITIPSILPTISVMFILQCGGLMSAGFDQIFNMQNAAVKDVADVLDVYIYRITFQASTDFGFSTAVALFRSVINALFLVVSNLTSRKLTGNGIFG